MTDRIDAAFGALDQMEAPVIWADVEARAVDDLPPSALIDTEPRRPRRPAWQPLAAAACVLIVLAGGAWFATRSSSSRSPEGGTAGDTIKVGVATVVIPDGMSLDGAVANGVNVARVRALFSTGAGTCTITSSGDQEPHSWTRERNSMGIRRYNAQLEGYARLRSSLSTRVAQLDQQINALPPGSAEAPSLASQRDAALRQIDDVNEAMFDLSRTGPERPPAREGFAPTDASHTTWRVQATPTDVVQVTCPDPATAQQLVVATTVPTPTP